MDTKFYLVEFHTRILAYTFYSQGSFWLKKLWLNLRVQLIEIDMPLVFSGNRRNFSHNYINCDLRAVYMEVSWPC